ncbi:MAG: SH3 domain-containing protein, partial [Coriobacteriia bacterium]|nr:SH3 domain-containing protein [Coriobacteriia bacterium]
MFGIAASAQAVTYSDLIWQAALTNNTNPYFLASRIRQEVCIGSGKSNSVTGTVSGYTGIYNFYNIGATAGGSGPVINGLIWAKSGTTYGRPWTDPQKSIVGGANYLAESYISVGQDSRYLQKFNVAPSNPSALYSHQYMTNLAAPLSEANTTYNAYNGVGALSLGMVFYVPVYNGMPALAGTPYTVSAASLSIRNAASTSGAIITSLSRGANVQVVTWNYATNVGGYNWAKVTLGNGITGYAAQGDSSGAYLTAISGGTGSDVAGFPASYQPYLKALRAKYPNWTIKPLNTGLDWNTAVSNEQGGKSAVPAPATGWVAAASSPMIAQPPTWVESGTWYRASQAAVAYYMDPRNALSPSGIFEFEQLSYNSSIQTEAGIQKLLTGTFMAGNNPVTYVNTSGVTQTMGVPASNPTNIKTSATSVALGSPLTISWTKVSGATKYRVRMY